MKTTAAGLSTIHRALGLWFADVCARVMRSEVHWPRMRRRTGLAFMLQVCLALALRLSSAGAAPATLTSTDKAVGPEWKVMDYGPFLSLTLEVAPGNIANKGIAVRLDPGDGGVAQGHEFFLFETDTLRAAAAWSGSEFIDWKNIALDGTHEVHASIVGEALFSNPDAPGWGSPEGQFTDPRITGRDGKHYGPLPREWAHWQGLYVCSNQVLLSYSIGTTEVLEMPAVERHASGRAVSRTFNISARKIKLVLQVGRTAEGTPGFGSLPADQVVVLSEAGAGRPGATAAVARGIPEGATWVLSGNDLRLAIPPGDAPLRFKVWVVRSSVDAVASAQALARDPAPVQDLTAWTRGGSARWPEVLTTKVERVLDARQPYQVESITVPFNNPYRSWMRLSAFDFFKDGHRAAVCTWQGDVWLVDGLGGNLTAFSWKRIASGLFQPLGLKIVDDQIYVTCRDQITVLRDLNGDGETDFYENFNNDAQVTEHFHEFAMDLQTDGEGNFYYAKGGRHAKDALVLQHGTLLRVSKDGKRTELVASGFRAPNGVCVNGDGTFIVSDQEGHWTPENRINWVRPGRFYGYMMGYHDGRAEDDFEQPVVWIHKSLDRSPAEQLWVASDRWGPVRSNLVSLSYGTGKILEVLYEKVGGVVQGGVIAMPIPAMPTGIMRGRFHPQDGQLYVAGLFGWAGDKTRPGGFFRIRYLNKPVHLPVALHATTEGMIIRFATPLDGESAADPQNYAVSRWTYRRTANYGSDDFKLSDPNQRGRDSVPIRSVRVSADHRSVLLELEDMRPCPQMEIKYNLQTESGTTVSQLIENTVLTLGKDARLDP